MPTALANLRTPAHHLRMRRVLVLPVLWSLTACYAYAPINATSIQPGMGVRTRIAANTAEQLEPLLGTSDARLLTGSVVESRSDTLVLEVPTAVTAAVGSSMQRLNQRVAIARSSIVEIESRTLNRGKTAVAIGVGTAAIGALILNATVWNPGSQSPPGGSGGADIRLTLLGWKY